MTTFRIEFRLPEFRHALKGDAEWKEMNGEEFRNAEVAELRKAGYWEKLGLPVEFRCVQVHYTKMSNNISLASPHIVTGGSASIPLLPAK